MLEDRIACWLYGLGISPDTFFTVITLIAFISVFAIGFIVGDSRRQKKTPVKPQPKPKTKVIIYPPDCFYDQEKDE